MASSLFVSEDEEEDIIFVTLAWAAHLVTSITSRDEDESSTPAPPSPSSDMLDVCKRATSWLAVPWPAAVTETTRSRTRG